MNPTALAASIDGHLQYIDTLSHDEVLFFTPVPHCLSLSPVSVYVDIDGLGCMPAMERG